MAAKLRQLAAPNHSTNDGDGSPATRAAIGALLPASRRRLDMMSTLATGWLPWGVHWEPHLTRHGNEWVLCCGHVFGFDEVSLFVTFGLLEEIRLPLDRQGLAITPAGRAWLSANWTKARLRGLQQIASRPPRTYRPNTEPEF